MNRRLFLSASTWLIGGDAWRIAHAAAKPAAHTVVIEGMQFKPATVNIRAKDSVTWINKDVVVHTATAAASVTPRFDSQLIGLGKSWTHAFTRVGVHDYVCTYHATMKGVIKVA